MPSRCCVPRCKGNYRTGPSVSVFSFPRNEDLKEKWTKAINRKNFTPTKYSKVCEKHFLDVDFEYFAEGFDEKKNVLIKVRLARRRLKHGAIPSQFPDQPVPSRTLSPESKKEKLEIDQLSNVVEGSLQQKGELENHEQFEFFTRAIQFIDNDTVVERESKVRKKWKYLRDQFSIELAKFKSARSDNGSEDSDEAESPKWCHFKHLLFLKDNVKPRQLLALGGNTTTEEYYPNIAAESQEAPCHSRNDDDSLDVTTPTVIFHEEELDPIDIIGTGSPNNSEDTDNYLPQILKVVSQAKQQQQVKKKRRKRKAREINSLQENGADDIDEEELIPDDPMLIKTEDNEDEDLLFFKSLLPHIRSIPANRKLPFRSRILEVVGQFAHYSCDEFSD